MKSISRLRQSTCGFPIREKIEHIPKSEIRGSYGLNSSAKALVIVGGSQGAKVLNDWVMKYEKLLMDDGISIYCVTGPNKKEAGFRNQKRVNASGVPVECRYFEFHHQIGELYSLADLTIARAGAGTIAELIECLCPSILIPYPYAADNHQAANASFMEVKGTALNLDQGRMDSLYREVSDLIFNSWMLGKMRDNLRKLNEEDGAVQLTTKINEILAMQAIDQQASATGNI